MLAKLNKNAGAVSVIAMLVGFIAQAIWTEATSKVRLDALEKGDTETSKDRLSAASKFANLDARLAGVERTTIDTNNNVKALYELLAQRQNAVWDNRLKSIPNSWWMEANRHPPPKPIPSR